MIDSKKSYKDYIKQDQLARGIKTDTISQKLKQFLYTDPTWKFQKRLRKLEYYTNCKKGLVFKIYRYYLEYKYKKLSIQLGFSIPKNAFGPGLSIPHYGNIVVHSRAKIGANCKIHSGVNIGASSGSALAPKLGDNVYLGPGCKVYGEIEIGNNIAIAANASVGKTFLEENIVIGGIPAKKIKEIDIKKIIKQI